MNQNLGLQLTKSPQKFNIVQIGPNPQITTTKHYIPSIKLLIAIKVFMSLLEVSRAEKGKKQKKN